VFQHAADEGRLDELACVAVCGAAPAPGHRGGAGSGLPAPSSDDDVVTVALAGPICCSRGPLAAPIAAMRT